MATLTFTPNPSTGRYEAECVSGDKNVLQVEFNDSQLLRFRVIEVFIRVDPALSWSRIKLFSQQVDNFPVAINVPAGIEIKVSVDEMPKQAAFLA